MITEEELKENGFVHTDDWNNRSYYGKGDFEIVEHNGKIYRCNDNNWSGYGKEIKTIKELNEIFSIYVDREVKRKIKEIDNLIKLK